MSTPFWFGIVVVLAFLCVLTAVALPAFMPALFDFERRLMQMRPSFHEKNDPEGMPRRRYRAEALLLARRMRELVEPVNRRMLPWRERLVLLKARQAKWGFGADILPDAAELKAEVLLEVYAFDMQLEKAPEARASVRVSDTEQALRSIVSDLDRLVVRASRR